MVVRSPFPIPFGWFQVAWSTDLAPGDVEPIEVFGRKLVAWRSEDGVAHVTDAFCPHLGAHFGYGGHVNGNDIVCPFHGWRFDGEGCNTHIPYSNRTNKKACIETFGTRRGKALWRRFRVHFTPKHASWLNAAEMEASLVGRQCLGKRRISTLAELRRQVRAWRRVATFEGCSIRWRFRVSDARRVFRYDRLVFRRSKH